MLQGKKEGDLAFIKVSDMSLSGNERFITVANNYVDEGTATRLGANVFPARSTVFAKVGAALLLNRRRMLTSPTIIDNNMMAAIPTEADPEFLFHFLCSVDFANYVQMGALPSINQSALGAIPFPKLSMPQQRRIAEILSTLDEAIAQTEALIAKHRQIKAGLMHDLFTRGVTPDGHLRPTREQAPDLYKDSPLGWIPKEWQYELLDDLAVRGSGHTPNKNSPEYWNGGIKWISLADSYRLDRLYITDTEYEISQLGIQNSSAVVHPAGMVVLSRDAGVGKSAITTGPMAVSQHFMCWRCDGRLNRHFLYYWLQFKKRMFENIAMGSTILTIGLPYFKKLKIAAPKDPEEQKMIGGSLLSANEKIFSLEADLEKKKQQKHGLMHDLLTGKVRVKLDTKTQELVDG